MILAPSAIVMLLGLAIYGYFDGKAMDLGRIMFFVGLFWFVYTMAGETIHIR